MKAFRVTIKDSKPQVGIFEIVDGTLYPVTEDLDVTKAVGGSVDAGHLFHRDLCREIAKMPEISEESRRILNSGRQAVWQKFPRGRVWYNVPDDKFYVSSDRSVLTNQKHVAEIMEAFSLPRNKTQLLVDGAYYVQD